MLLWGGYNTNMKYVKLDVSQCQQHRLEGCSFQKVQYIYNYAKQCPNAKLVVGSVTICVLGSDIISKLRIGQPQLHRRRGRETRLLKWKHLDQFREKLE